MVQDPPSTLVPGMRSFIRLIVRSRVDLPQPDGPMSAVIWFGVNVDRHVLHRPERAVVERHVLQADDRLRRGSASGAMSCACASEATAAADEPSAAAMTGTGAWTWSSWMGSGSATGAAAVPLVDGASLEAGASVWCGRRRWAWRSRSWGLPRVGITRSARSGCGGRSRSALANSVITRSDDDRGRGIGPERLLRLARPVVDDDRQRGVGTRSGAGGRSTPRTSPGPRRRGSAGAVSPSARDRASTVPVRTPGAAAGRTSCG